MNQPTHFIYGMNIALFYVNTQGLNGLEYFDSILFTGFAALIPDIDHPGSAISKVLKPVSKVFNALERLIMPSSMQHRGITHTLVPLALAYGGWHFTHFKSIMFTGQGIATHIFLDLFTKMGVPLLWPLTKFRLKIPLFKTGGKGEEMVSVIGWVLFFTQILCNLNVFKEVIEWLRY